MFICISEKKKRKIHGGAHEDLDNEPMSWLDRGMGGKRIRICHSILGHI